eukprot:7779540-Pyramimonas_sp.AAC.1
MPLVFFTINWVLEVKNASYQRCEHPGFPGAIPGGAEGVRRGCIWWGGYLSAPSRKPTFPALASLVICLSFVFSTFLQKRSFSLVGRKEGHPTVLK